MDGTYRQQRLCVLLDEDICSTSQRLRVLELEAPDDKLLGRGVGGHAAKGVESTWEKRARQRGARWASGAISIF